MQRHFSRNGRGKKPAGKKSEASVVARDQNPLQLPQLTDQLCVGFTFRFVTTPVNATPYVDVTAQNLLDAWFLAATATSGKQLFDFIRIKRITIRATGNNVVGSGAALQAGVTVGVEFPGLVAGSLGGGKARQCSGLGMEPAMVSVVPDRLSQAAQFQPSSNAVVATLRITDYSGAWCAGALIDVECVLKNTPDISPASIASAPAGMVAGNLYFGGIDGGRLAATKAKSVFNIAI